MLAETLRPELHEPVGEIAQWIGIRHEDVDVPSELAVGQKLQGGEEAGGIGAKRVTGAPLRDVGGAGKELGGVDPYERRGKNSDRSEHAEAPADVGRNIQCRDTLASGDGAKCTSFRIGDEHKMSPRVVPERGVE